MILRPRAGAGSSWSGVRATAAAPTAARPAAAGRSAARSTAASLAPRWIGQESVLILVDVERRGGADRRHGGERRASRDRRGGVERRGQTVGEHVRNAVQLIGHVAQSGDLDDELRRDLDGALFRLRFALDRLGERGES